MAIMKLSSVPELNEFAGTEKFYINDNGETKQIDANKFAPEKTEKIVWIYDPSNMLNIETIVKALEDGRDIWMQKDGQLYQFLSYALYAFCGPMSVLVGSYLVINEAGANGNGGTINTVMIGQLYSTTDSDLIARLNALGL